MIASMIGSLSLDQSTIDWQSLPFNSNALKDPGRLAVKLPTSVSAPLRRILVALVSWWFSPLNHTIEARARNHTTQIID
jgi:hypothetical protein